jgi:hypothetical protein
LQWKSPSHVESTPPHCREGHWLSSVSINSIGKVKTFSQFRVCVDWKP